MVAKLTVVFSLTFQAASYCIQFGSQEMHLTGGPSLELCNVLWLSAVIREDVSHEELPRVHICMCACMCQYEGLIRFFSDNHQRQSQSHEYPGVMGPS